jgi:cytochrome c biogenesis protein CcmG, thiol:disulfide interchange protein DsbE
MTARRPVAPLNVLMRVFDRRMRLRRRGAIARQVGEIGARHRLRGTAAGGRCFSVDRRDEQHRGQNLQHALLGIRHLIKLVSGDDFQAINRPARRSPPVRLRQGRSLSIAAAVAAILGAASAPTHAAPEIGAAAPALVLTALDGQTFDLAKLHGTVVLVNYWATWCAPCRKEMPKLNAFYRRYHDRGLEIIGISIDFPRDAAKAEKAAKALAYPTALAKAITEDGFGKPQGVPITWVIDADGKIRDRFIEVRDELLNGIVVPLLPH